MKVKIVKNDQKEKVVRIFGRWFEKRI